MLTHDETKRGLECCETENCHECPYRYYVLLCRQRLHGDALALIQQLEAERDAAVADMKNSRDCQCCKHYDVKWDEPCVHCDNDNNCFEWRGVHKEE